MLGEVAVEGGRRRRMLHLPRQGLLQVRVSQERAEHGLARIEQPATQGLEQPEGPGAAHRRAGGEVELHLLLRQARGDARQAVGGEQAEADVLGRMLRRGVLQHRHHPVRLLIRVEAEFKLSRGDLQGLLGPVLREREAPGVEAGGVLLRGGEMDLALERGGGHDPALQAVRLDHAGQEQRAREGLDLPLGQRGQAHQVGVPGAVGGQARGIALLDLSQEFPPGAVPRLRLAGHGGEVPALGGELGMEPAHHLDQGEPGRGVVSRWRIRQQGLPGPSRGGTQGGEPGQLALAVVGAGERPAGELVRELG
jgi:hypothetical protein